MPKLCLKPSHIYQNHHLDSSRWDAYAPRENDIIISTSLKSGTTWTQAIVRELIVHAMQQAGIVEPIYFPAPDYNASFWVERLGESVDELHAKLEAQRHRRFLKTHLALDGLPLYTQVKYLVVARDPRDVFISLWNQYSSDYTEQMYTQINSGLRGAAFPRCPDDIHDFWAMWIGRGWFDWEHEGYPFWGNMRHVQSWWNYRHLDNILLLHYADMLANPAKEIRRIADFIEIEISDSVLTHVVDHTRIDAMRQRALAAESVSDYRQISQNLFNKAINGRWKKILNETELIMYEQTKAKVLSPDCARWLELGARNLCTT